MKTTALSSVVPAVSLTISFIRWGRGREGRKGEDVFLMPSTTQFVFCSLPATHFPQAVTVWGHQYLTD